MTPKKKTEKPGHYDYRTTVRVIHETRSPEPYSYVEVQQDREGLTIAHYYGPHARRRAREHAAKLRASLKPVKP